MSHIWHFRKGLNKVLKNCWNWSNKFYLFYICHTFSCLVDKYSFIWPSCHVVHPVVVYFTPRLPLQPHNGTVVPFGRRHHYFYGDIGKTATHIYSPYCFGSQFVFITNSASWGRNLEFLNILNQLRQKGSWVSST